MRNRNSKLHRNREKQFPEIEEGIKEINNTKSVRDLYDDSFSYIAVKAGQVCHK